MIKSWTDEAWDDYLYWADQDRKIFRRINKLVKDIDRGGSGIGKPELLKHDLSGYMSRRITEEHRLVYKITDGKIFIIQCRCHYE